MKDIELRWIWQDRHFTDENGIQYATKDRVLQYRQLRGNDQGQIWTDWITVPEVKE